MKQILIIIVSILLSLTTFANNIDNNKIKNESKTKITQNTELAIANVASSVVNFNVIPSDMQQIDCTLTITVTIGNDIVGSVSASLSITGPCDEVIANADALFQNVLDLAKKKWDEL